MWCFDNHFNEKRCLVKLKFDGCGKNLLFVLYHNIDWDLRVPQFFKLLPLPLSHCGKEAAF